MIKYGDCADRLDEHLQISQTVYNESMKAFCKVVVNEFRNEYLNRVLYGIFGHQEIHCLSGRDIHDHPA